METRFVRFKTSDNLVLQGLLHLPISTSKGVYLHVHGMAGNFYENLFLDDLARELTNAGFAFMTFNNRGHDFVADFVVYGEREEYRRIGNEYEKFDDCVLDIGAAIDWLEQNGFGEVVLGGHSLGAVKVAHYMIKTKDIRVKKLSLISPPDMVALIEVEPYHKKLFDLSQRLVGEGRSRDLLPDLVWDGYMLSAATYLDFFSRDGAVDIFNFYDRQKISSLQQIRIPTLAVYASDDDACVVSASEALSILRDKMLDSTPLETSIISETTHSYFGKGVELAKVILNWI